MKSDYLNLASDVLEAPLPPAQLDPTDVLQLAIAGLQVTVAEIFNSPLFDNDDLRLIASGELTTSELRYYISAWLDYGRCIPFPLP